MITLFARIVKPGLLGLGKQDLRDCGREAIRAAGFEWHRRYKSFHFQRFAFAKYGYERRSYAYEARKRREHPEAQGRPLVFTGDSERSAMASNTVVATAASWESYSAAVHVDAPTLNYQRLHKELTRVTVHEQRALAEVFRREFERQMVARANLKIVPLEMTTRVA